MKIFYRVNGSEFDVEIRRVSLSWKLDLADARDRRVAAELCADDYHSNHDGWESRWPLKLEILVGEGGDVLARFEIERESVPSFSASEIEAEG